MTFTNADGKSTTVNKTALDSGYGNYKYICGFIVGTSMYTNLQTNLWDLYAFDLACPNCNSEDLVNKALQFRSDRSSVECSRCHRVYDLNQGGLITEGDDGIKLYRYRIQYGNNTVVISN